MANASGISISTIKRLEAEDRPGPLGGRRETAHNITEALQKGGIEFTNGDQPGVRLKAQGRGGMSVEDLNASNDE
jgi:hypothetical protein